MAPGLEFEVLGEIAQGKNNAAIAAGLFLTERAIEKRTNATFSKPGVSEERDVRERVNATVIYLANSRRESRDPDASSVGAGVPMDRWRVLAGLSS